MPVLTSTEIVAIASALRKQSEELPRGSFEWAVNQAALEKVSELNILAQFRLSEVF